MNTKYRDAMGQLKFASINDAKQYCDGCTDWEFDNNINLIKLAETCNAYNCCISCAIKILESNPKNYGVKCDCKLIDD